MDSQYNRVLIGNKLNADKKTTYIRTENEYYKQLSLLDEKGVFFEKVGSDEYKVKPYFDLDGRGNIELDKIYDEFEKDLNKIYDAPIASMGRETREEKGKIKHSRRYYLLNTKIFYSSIKYFFKDLFDKYGKKGLDILDEGIYDSNRKYYLPLSSYKIRNEGKKTIVYSVPKLELIKGSIFDNCASYIEENYIDLDEIYYIKNNEILKKNNIDNTNKKEEIQIKLQNILDEDIDIDEDEEETDTDKYIKISKIIERLSNNRADDYNSWISVIWCIINISQREKITKRKMNELIHQFSRKSNKYDETEVDDIIDANIKNNTDKKYGWNYLYNICIKEDDKEYYDMLNRNYKNVKNNFEETHFKIIHPPMIITVDKNQNNIKQCEKDFIKSYRHIVYNKKNEDKKGKTKFIQKQFVSDWLNDPKIKLYEDINFNPPCYIRNENLSVKEQEKPDYQTNKDTYNLWTHYEILDTPYNNDTEEDKEYNKQIIEQLNIFMNNIFENNKEVIDYLKAYFANRLQKPYQRNKLCVIIKGSEGDGKNTFFDIIRGIIGRKYYSEIEEAKQIFGEHSLVEDSKLFVCVNEANPKHNYENSERLKSRITTDVVLVNPKGITPYEIQNRCDYLMTTNNDNCVKVDEGSRRYLLIKSSPYYKGNNDFFNDFYKNIINNKRALRAIYEYLINFNVSLIVPSLNFQDNRYLPITEYQKQVIKNNKDRILLFLEDLTLKNKHIEKKKYTNQAFFSEWTEWVKINNYKIDYNNISFATRLMMLVKKENLTNDIVKDVNKNTIINFENLFKYFNFIEENDD